PAVRVLEAPPEAGSRAWRDRVRAHHDGDAERQRVDGHTDRQPLRAGASVPTLDRVHGPRRYGALVRPAERYRVLAAAHAVGLLPVRDRSDHPAAGAHG